jgi:hypothetical protein
MVIHSTRRTPPGGKVSTCGSFNLCRANRGIGWKGNEVYYLSAEFFFIFLAEDVV